MKLLTILGLVFILLGAAALAYQSFTYTEEKDVVNLGVVKLTLKEEKQVPIPMYVGCAGIGIGVVLVVVGSLRK
jgi:uncharacterized membrane protein